jgi:hypothetical protein
MTASFEIPVVHPYLEKTQRRILFLHILSALVLFINAFGIYIITPDDVSVAVVLLVVALWIAFRGILFAKKKSGYSTKNTIVLRLLTVLAFILSGSSLIPAQYLLAGLLQYLLAGIIIVMAFVEYNVFSPAYILFYKEMITVPSPFGKQRFSWSVINSIILRNDLLTLNLNNNYFLQLEIKDSLAESEKTEIEKFVQEQISAAKKS